MLGMSLVLAMVWICVGIIGICISIAPLIIWRNTNRTNLMLALIAVQQGVPRAAITRVWEQGGSEVEHAFDPTEFEKNTAAAKQSANNFKIEAGDAEPTREPAVPTGRYCPACDTAAPLDATACPRCGREFPVHAVHCPKCGHEITHQPTVCPGCGTRYKYKGAAS